MNNCDQRWTRSNTKAPYNCLRWPGRRLARALRAHRGVAFDGDGVPHRILNGSRLTDGTAEPYRPSSPTARSSSGSLQFRGEEGRGFFSKDTSSRSLWFSLSNSRMRCCAGGLPAYAQTPISDHLHDMQLERCIKGSTGSRCRHGIQSVLSGKNPLSSCPLLLNHDTSKGARTAEELISRLAC